MRPLTIVKVWYQNDPQDSGHRDQWVVRALQDDPRVTRIVHLEPPVARERLDAARGSADPTLANAARRAAGVRDGKRWELTPTFSTAAGAGDPWRQVVAQVAAFLAEAGARGPDSILWVSAPSALGDRLVAAMGESFGRIVTELEDDHREYAPPRSAQRLALHRTYERLVRASDLLVANNPRLLDEWRAAQPAQRLVRNAVDAAAYATLPAEPGCLAGVARPRVAYAGNLRLRLQPDLFRAVAAAFPQATLLLAGVGGEALAPHLAGCANVRFVGALPSREVAPFLMHADVLLMPHAVGPLTDSMDPQKLNEYLASGRPVVATPVAGAREQGDLVALADDRDGFVAAVGAALRERDPAAAARRRARGLARGWSDVAREVVDAALSIERPLERLREETALGYFQHERPEVRALVPATARRVLDVGCGAGALGAALRFERPDVEVTGIELDPRAARRAAGSLARVLQGDALEKLAELEREGARFDAILFADLLEHLAQPEAALAHARRLLAPGGVVVASLPNVRHWSVVRPLLEGDFRYEAAGILDRTHLRFFTKRSAQRLLEDAGFAVDRCQGVHWDDGAMPEALVRALADGGLDVATLAAEAREQQWLFVARAAATTPAVARPPARTSVVIPVCNAVDYTRQVLEELAARGDGVVETIVVDNGSSDGTAELLARHPALRVIRNGENRGFAGAVNQGIEAARGDYVCVLNNDTLLTDGWLAAQVAWLERDESIGMVGPVTSYAKGRQQIDLGEGQPLPDRESLRARAAAWCARERGRVEDVAFLSGFCFSARRRELLPIGGLASAYGRGTFEDDELCRTMRRGGRRLVIARDGYVHHFGNRTFRALAIDLAAQQRENLRLFAERHRDDPGLLARLCAEQGKWRDVLRLAHAAMAREPRDLDALALAARAAAELGRPADAARLAARYLARCPHDRELAAVKARCESLSEQPRATRNEVPTAV